MCALDKNIKNTPENIGDIIKNLFEQPEIKAMIDECNSLGEEIKELKTKCIELKNS